MQKAGVVFNPGTPLTAIDYILDGEHNKKVDNNVYMLFPLLNG